MGVCLGLLGPLPTTPKHTPAMANSQHSKNPK